MTLNPSEEWIDHEASTTPPSRGAFSLPCNTCDPKPSTLALVHVTDDDAPVEVDDRVGQEDKTNEGAAHEHSGRSVHVAKGQQRREHERHEHSVGQRLKSSSTNGSSSDRGGRGGNRSKLEEAIPCQGCSCGSKKRLPSS